PLADETVVIGAHYDHVGMGGRGSLAPGSKAVHNGADDNASGTVALIELARRFGSRDKKPARRIVFIAFTAEERGLIGSAHYVKNPVFPLEKTIAMLNMDMVGRVTDDKLVVYGIGTTPRWKKLIEAEGKKHNFKLTLKEGGFGPSDHSSFYGKKMPVLHFFSGTHKDYHRPTDDWDKINLAGMSRVVQMVEEVADSTIATKERPKYIEVKRKSTQARTGSRPYFGSIPDFAENAKGYAIMAVAGGSPAAKGGLKGGDVIVGLGGQKIGNLSDFDLALRKFKAGDEVDIVVQRKGKEVKLKVILGKPR
ncbi:MAG: M20/M25/M40 family metallo-hydrolase, partial [Planctomycetaceae bacterium]|nr:M20/M25/M40 family metallo-hydrolase [Planctomycetaceae bacterium]